jgi:hypothetical protein
MVLRTGCPQKQKAQGDISATGLISIQEVTALCTRHQYNHLVVATPARIGVLAGVKICTAEAAQVRTFIIRLLAVFLKGKHSDLSQLPDQRTQAR